MFTVAVPVFVTVILCVLLPPTGMFPKLMLLGLAESTPALDPGFAPLVPALV
jgi:hypothetical protein